MKTDIYLICLMNIIFNVISKNERTNTECIKNK